MPDNMTFLSIATDWRVPGQYIEIDHSRAVQGLPGMRKPILILGQRLATGEAPSGKLMRITRDADGIKYFGRGSMLAQMIPAALKVNKTAEMYALALDDLSSGVAASWTIEVESQPLESGTPVLYIGGVRVPFGVKSGQTKDLVASAMVNAVNAKSDLALSASVSGAIVTLTAKHKGEEGNSIDIRWNYYDGERTPNGLSFSLTKKTEGTGNPDVLAAISAMSSGSFYTIVMPWTDVANTVAMENELQGRWGGMDMRTGHAFSVKSGSVASLCTFGNTRNSPHNSIIGMKGSPSLPWVIAAQVAAGVSFRGANDPALPFRGIELPDVLAPSESERFTDSERNLLLYNGMSTLIFDQAGQAMVEQVVTTYQKNSFGMEDRSLLKLNTKWTVDYMRYMFRFAIARDFPNHKLAGDDVLPRIAAGQRIATPKLIRNTLIAAAGQLEYVGLLENLEAFKRELIVVRSEADECRVNAMIPPNVVNQFDVFAAAVQFIL